MNGEDLFEKQLERQPLRPVPPAWREEILSAARQALRYAHASRLTHHVPARRTLLSILSSQLSTLLWPHPRAWAGLAAAWLLVIGLQLAAHEPAGPEIANQPARPSPQMRELLQQQEQLFAELIGPMESPAVIRPKPLLPAPHSQLRLLTPSPGSAGIPAGKLWRTLAFAPNTGENAQLAGEMPALPGGGRRAMFDT